MKKFSFVLLSLLLFLGIYTPSTQASMEYNLCDQYKGQKKIWWDGIELTAGQIGRLIVVKDTPLYTYDRNGKQIVSRTLKAGEFYRIYNFKPGQLGVGGAYYVLRDKNIRYETPSKGKLEAVKCVNGTHLTQIYRKHINTQELWTLFDRINTVNEKVSRNSYKDYHSLVDDLGPLADEYRSLKNLTSGQKNVFETWLNKSTSSNKVFPKLGKMVVTFESGESYLMENPPLGYKKFGDKQYINMQLTNILLNLASGSYILNKQDSLPGGLDGKISVGHMAKIQQERIYTDLSDIDSSYFVKYTIEAEGIEPFSSFDSRIHLLGIGYHNIYSTVDFNTMLEDWNLKGALNSDRLDIQLSVKSKY
ncbi:hypothetical protein [Cytobacillus firmus]|uniref:hypothetical protein n=1 Tax=Cytobacillus firmus TaxID=1399 RepID=UPI0018CDBFB3|nr:hypothetical protein [Cytobacillus firmus]MED1908876.1 hypothetical protein [Cytobacillus firmus]